MLATRIGRRGQITLPREIRRSMGADEGDQIVFFINGGQVIIMPITQTLLDLRGSVRVPGEQDFASIRKQVLAERATREGKNGS